MNIEMGLAHPPSMVPEETAERLPQLTEVL